MVDNLTPMVNEIETTGRYLVLLREDAVDAGVQRQFKSEVHHHLTDPRIPHGGFDNLTLSSVAD